MTSLTLKLPILGKLDDYFSVDREEADGGYFYRISCHNETLDLFLERYYKEAAKNGSVISGGLLNPGNHELAYFTEVFGQTFSMTPVFIKNSIKKWLPSLTIKQSDILSMSVFTLLKEKQRQGKTESALKNLYVKVMCWFYYKLQGSLSKISTGVVPKILCEGTLTEYSLTLLSILRKCGCDVLLLVSDTAAYQKLDARDSFSLDLSGVSGISLSDAVPIGKEFTIKMIADFASKRQRKEQQKAMFQTSLSVYTNDCRFDDVFYVLKKSTERYDGNICHNLFLHLCGVPDRMTFSSSFSDLKAGYGQMNIPFVIKHGGFTVPKPAEVSKIVHQDYKDKESALLHLINNISCSDKDLCGLMKKAFYEEMTEGEFVSQMSIRKFINTSVYMLCWLNEIKDELFHKGKLGCLFYVGDCSDSVNAIFLSFLSRLPCDVIVVSTKESDQCMIHTRIKDLSFDSYLTDDSFLSGGIGTVARQAENDLDQLLYQDTGLYRNRQYQNANVCLLHSTYEEIKLLWEEDLPMRTGFSSENDCVSMPVFFARVSGIKEGSKDIYWKLVQSYITEDTITIDKFPYKDKSAFVSLTDTMAKYVRLNNRRKLDKEGIISDVHYRYRMLRDETQDYIMDKMLMLLTGDYVTFSGGGEYLAAAICMSLPQDVVHLLQNFDFTKKNPKLVAVNVSENLPSFEDSIFFLFLHLLGFDILYFAPTGYKGIESYYSFAIDDYQLGPYAYDLILPELTMLSNHSSQKKKRGFLKRIFGN